MGGNGGGTRSRVASHTQKVPFTLEINLQLEESLF